MAQVDGQVVGILIMRDEQVGAVYTSSSSDEPDGVGGCFWSCINKCFIENVLLSKHFFTAQLQTLS